MRKGLLGLCLTLLALPSGAAEWFVAECASHHRGQLEKNFADAASYDKALLAARPGSPLYLPRPFPVSDEAVIEDLRWSYQRTWSTTKEKDLPADEKPLYRALKDEKTIYEIHRVANWTPHRCNEVRPRNFFFLVSILDKTRAEVARFNVDRYGRVMAYVTPPEDQTPEQRIEWRESFVGLKQAQARVTRLFGVKGSDPQYVESYGPRPYCRSLSPCIALQSEGATFLFQPRNGGHLFRFTPESRRVSLAEQGDMFSRGLLGKANAQEEALLTNLISLADSYVQVEVVPASKGRP